MHLLLVRQPGSPTSPMTTEVWALEAACYDAFLQIDVQTQRPQRRGFFAHFEKHSVKE